MAKSKEQLQKELDYLDHMIDDMDNAKSVHLFVRRGNKKIEYTVPNQITANLYSNIVKLRRDVESEIVGR